MSTDVKDNAARDAFERVWADWTSLSLRDGEVLQDEWLFKLGPSTYVTESLEGGPGALIWAVNDYWAIKFINGDKPAEDVDRGTWMPPGLCGLPDRYRQREVHAAAQAIEGTRPLSVNAAYNVGTGEFKFTEIAATPYITSFYDTRETDSDNEPVIITFTPQDIGPLNDNLTSQLG